MTKPFKNSWLLIELQTCHLPPGEPLDGFIAKVQSHLNNLPEVKNTRFLNNVTADKEG